ncbi:MAG: class I SAM-dependent methyltransferase [Oscillospiraceae bacterium]|jgi:SAM-dependent methyltransferase|nr:class I SAM-dependent methyltransferase [Oscillospiraceae bacterium]
MDGKNYADVNAETFDRWVENGWEWGVPITREEYAAAGRGVWRVLLTPTKPVPSEWFAPFLKDGRLDGVKLLGLASGGGQQMPIFAALGATGTVLDYSDAQLASERLVSEREGYAIDIVKADMTKRLPFDDAAFDVIFHPVANCYIEDVQHVWNECYRVLKPGGVLLAGMDSGLNFLIEKDEEPLIIKNKLPFNPLKDPVLMETLKQNDDGVQFSHSLEEQLGGQLKAGLRLTALFDDYNGSGALREYAPTFIATRAVKD